MPGDHRNPARRCYHGLGKNARGPNAAPSRISWRISRTEGRSPRRLHRRGAEDAETSLHLRTARLMPPFGTAELFPSTRTFLRIAPPRPSTRRESLVISIGLRDWEFFRNSRLIFAARHKPLRQRPAPERASSKRAVRRDRCGEQFPSPGANFRRCPEVTLCNTRRASVTAHNPLRQKPFGPSSRFERANSRSKQVQTCTSSSPPVGRSMSAWHPIIWSWPGSSVRGRSISEVAGDPARAATTNRAIRPRARGDLSVAASRARRTSCRCFNPRRRAGGDA